MSSFFGNWFSGNKEASPDANGDPAAPGEASGPTSDHHEVALALTSVKASAPPSPPALPPKPRYGIDDAIKLMRTLPVDEHVDLVVRVIKHTLSSLNVRVADIIEDAGRRQEGLSNAITEHETSILKLEREIESRRNEIAHLQDELAETSTVRERLELAEQLPATPMAPRVTATSVAPTPKKSAAPPLNRSVPPPIPRGDTSYRPRMNSSDLKKGIGGPPPPVNDAKPGDAKAADAKPGDAKPGEPKAPADDDDMPVESRDFVEKNP